MYELAVPYFPENEKLLKKISDLKDKDKKPPAPPPTSSNSVFKPKSTSLDLHQYRQQHHENASSSYSSTLRQELLVSEETFLPHHAPAPQRPKPKRTFAVFSDNTTTEYKHSKHESDDEYRDEEDEDEDDDEAWEPDVQQTPRTQALLKIINSEDVAQIMKLKVCSLRPFLSLV